MTLYESYKELLKLHFEMEYVDNGRPTQESLLLNLVESRFKGMETRIEELEKRVDKQHRNHIKGVTL